MNYNKYTDQEREILLKNPNILKVGDRNITYNNEFKLKAIKKNEEGVSPIQIFKEAGINVSILGVANPKSCIKKWKKIYKKYGEQGLIKEKRGHGKGEGRPQYKKLTLEDKLKQAKTRIAYLEAENEYLKKLEELERGSI